MTDFPCGVWCGHKFSTFKSFQDHTLGTMTLKCPGNNWKSLITPGNRKISTWLRKENQYQGDTDVETVLGQEQWVTCTPILHRPVWRLGKHHHCEEQVTWDQGSAQGWRRPGRYLQKRVQLGMRRGEEHLTPVRWFAWSTVEIVASILRVFPMS